MAMGRPKIQIDWKTAEGLAAIACTGSEIASVLGICYDTLKTAVERDTGLTFSEWYKKHSEMGQASLRRVQYKAAVEDKSVPMMIWLGKQLLGQTDKRDVEKDSKQSEVPIKLVFSVINKKDE
jgi:hypothetical protein